MNVILLVVTALSLALAATMTVRARRLIREDLRRSEARVAALAAEVQSTPFRSEPESGWRPASVSSLPNDLFAARDESSSSRWSIALASGLCVVAGAAALVLLMSQLHASSARSSARSVQPPAAATDVRALELVALDHEQDGDRLTVRGIVRNPRSGNGINGLSAVVFLYNRDGGFLGSGRAAVDAPSLSAGAEAAFSVAVPNAADVGRYRVSFRIDDRVLPHVDRRKATRDPE